jgi:hypothetical protein
MYTPSFATIARALGVQKDVVKGPATAPVVIDAGALRILLKFVAAAADFDSEVYLQENPDIAAAFESKQITNLHAHYVNSGFFEGRAATRLKIDEEWYLKTYPDVAAAIRENIIESASAHFERRGETEMRAPSEDALPWLMDWAEALARPRPPYSV